MPPQKPPPRQERGVISSAVTSATGGQSLGQDAFLKLLVTQLQNQDPLNPQDQTQFLAQLAQFSTVEGVTNVSNSETKLRGADMLGKTVSATSIQNGIQTDVNGQVTNVKFSGNNVMLTVKGYDYDISLADVQNVSTTPVK